MKEILKWPLIIAAAVVVLRVVVERAGAPDSVANYLSVVALHFVIAPVYFSIRIAWSGASRPYSTLFKLIAWYVVSRFHQGIEEIDKELIFEENAPAPFELLDLGRGD